MLASANGTNLTLLRLEMNERIQKLAEQAGWDLWEGRAQRDMTGCDTELQKFAELIVAECTSALFDESERLSGLYSEEANWNSAEEYEIRSNQCIEDIALIEKHFGVEEE
jgi:hypothetical protein